jgi:hypothetical protein
MLTAAGARVVLEVPQSLIQLLHSANWGISIIPKNAPLPEGIDFHIPMLSLPLAFNTTESTIPSSVPYLSAQRQSMSKWGERLAHLGKKRKIGLVWSGSTEHKGDRKRSLLLDSLIPFLPESFTYVSLQNAIRTEDQTTLRDSNILHFETDLTDFSETAALAKHMELIVSVDTSVAHMAGAMALPVWVLLPYNPDWRWLYDREDSPWYPTMRLFRQSERRDWSEVLDRIRHELERIQ